MGYSSGVTQELNFDGLVGPTHNFGGISFGNLASSANSGSLSNPRQAALQGLDKMRLLHELGVPQAILPPHHRPELSLARRLGFTGDDVAILNRLAREEPLLLAACYSASSMWTANAATVSPSADSRDGRVHLTPANLLNKIHRSIETPTTHRVLKAVFRDAERFVVHEPLPSTAALGDEGAANHTRLCTEHGAVGVQLFVYGESAANPWVAKPKTFPARHTLEASQALARLHDLPSERVVMAQQNPKAIDQGVFHNDVISVGDRDFFLHHAEAFVDTAATIDELRRAFAASTDGELSCFEIPADEVPLAKAVSTYLFNSQLVALPDGRRALVAPTECQEDEAVRDVIDRMVSSGVPVHEVRYVDLRQSMRGGGGPACLRLRVCLTDDEQSAMAQGVRYTPQHHRAIADWITRRYRTELCPADLADPDLLDEVRVALDELTTMLGLGAIYPFQLDGSVPAGAARQRAAKSKAT